MKSFPIVDLHCDLLSYLAEVDGSTPFDTDNIGCAIPSLRDGNVNLQIMAIYTPTEKGSTAFASKQAEIFQSLLENYKDHFRLVENSEDINSLKGWDKIGIIGAIENASAFCEEDEHLDTGFKKLDNLISAFGKVAYVTFTHMGENRFGGGNLSDVGLKDDGRALLEYLNDKYIPVDFSHMSDSLAADVINYIDNNNLKMPILASHSNFRRVHAHKGKRNLPDEIVAEISRKGGIIGINFIKDFIGHSGPQDIYKHILYAFEEGYENNIAFGADFFWAPPGYKCDTGDFFYSEHINASKYQVVLGDLKDNLAEEELNKLSHLNAVNFFSNIL
ncbi:dipeptidase [Bacteroidota bacterium]